MTKPTVGWGISKYLLPTLSAFALLLAIGFTLLYPNVVQAAGTVGNPGAGSGTAGGAHTNNGYGWYKFNTSGAGTGSPGYMRSGNWADVQAICAAANARTITAFIVMTPTRTVGTSVVYTYNSSSYGTYPRYLGNSGGYWQTYAEAQASFNALPSQGVDITGYTFGRNVGYFCSDLRPRDYSLTPAITADQTAGVSGSTVTLFPTVQNTKTAASSGTQYQVSRFVPSVEYPGAGNSNSAPSPYYANTITPVANATGQSYPGSATTRLSAITTTIPDLPVGSLVCYAFSVKDRASDSAQWAHTGAVCLRIAVKPLVQVWGGDLSAGKSFLGTSVTLPTANIDTSVSTKTIASGNYTFGSWVEYGVFARGSITNIGSAAAYAGTASAQGLVNASLCRASYLTFNNASGARNVCTGSSYTTLGGYSTSRSIPDVASSYPVTSSTPQYGSRSLNDAATQGLYTSSSTLTLTGGTINAGRWVVIHAPNASVTITGDIRYTTDTLSSVSDIPQVIIIARNINITDAVRQVDAWLIAKPSTTLADGVINTCSSVAENAPLSSTICANPLVVNGPVMANKLLLRRTTGPGTGTSSGNPAETFNLRPDAYLWAYSHTPSNGRVQTVYTTELPPRL